MYYKSHCYSFAKPTYLTVINIKHMEKIMIIFSRKTNIMALKIYIKSYFQTLFFISIASLQCSGVNYKMIFDFNNQEVGSISHIKMELL